MKKMKKLSLFCMLILTLFFSEYAEALINSIHVNQNSAQFTITQSANPTTGYSWKLISYDKKILKLIREHYCPPKTSRSGAGGRTEWTFLVYPDIFKTIQHTLRTTIQLRYARPWDITDHPTYATIIVVVKKANA